MALRIIKRKTFQIKSLVKETVCNRNVLPKLTQFRTTTSNYVETKIGSREIVGYGVNSNPMYVDWICFPFPAIRFREVTHEIAELRIKEKGDWRQLTVAERKALYRASFCQTLAEITAPTGQWKFCLAIALHCVAIGIFTIFFHKKFVYSPLPDTFTDDKIKAQFQRIIDLEMNPITGISSKYDYETQKAK